MWKVEIRTRCKICKALLPKRFRTFCSAKCRHKDEAQRYKKQRALWQREKRGRYSPNKKRCIICGRWYVQIGTHIVQRHRMTAREYREEFNLPVKRGILPAWYREIKGRQALENKTSENLKAGKKFWFKKNDKRAKANTFWKGHKYKPDEYYE